MTRDIQDIRRDIDSVDRQLHDLLMKRGELTDEIGRIKQKNKARIIHPDREAALLKSVLERHKGPFPKQAVVAVWRQIIGALSSIQGQSIKIAVACDEDNDAEGFEIFELSKNYFSSILPVKRSVSPLAVLSMVREGDVTFGVLPWPEDGTGDKAWWRLMFEETGENGLNIIGRLPFANHSADMNPEHRALIIAQIPFNPSGDDHSFLAIELETDISRSLVVSKAESVGFQPVSVYNCKCQSNMWNFRLLEVKGYVERHDKKIDAFHEALEDAQARISVIGGYPAPPVLKN